MAMFSRSNVILSIIPSVLLSLIIVPGRIGREVHRGAAVREF